MNAPSAVRGTGVATQPRRARCACRASTPALQAKARAQIVRKGTMRLRVAVLVARLAVVVSIKQGLQALRARRAALDGRRPSNWQLFLAFHVTQEA